MQLAHKYEALCNMLDKYGLHMQYFENIIADRSKHTDTVMLESKRRQLETAEILVFSPLFFDLLQTAKLSNLTTRI